MQNFFLCLFLYFSLISAYAIQEKASFPKGKKQEILIQRKSLSLEKEIPSSEKNIQPSQHADTQKNQKAKEKPEEAIFYKPLKGFMITFKPAAFYFQDNAIRHIYDNVSYMSLLEFDQSVKDNWHIYLEAGYLRSHGKIAHTVEVTWTLAPLALGVKYIQPIKSYVYLYAKLAPALILAKSKLDNSNTYPWVPRVSFKKIWGAQAGVGSLLHLYREFYLDLFFSYFLGKNSFIDTNSNTRIKLWAGGFATIIGLGYKF